jgi:N-acetylneuraminic acid mutarotase
MPTAREHLASSVIEGKLYVVGGRWETNLPTLEVYDPAQDTWQGLEAMPTARGGLTTSAVNGLLYVTGGEAFPGEGCTFNRVEVYDPVQGSWLRAPDLPTARHGLTSVAFEGRWYVIGGATRAGAGTFESASDRVEILIIERPEDAD